MKDSNKFIFSGTIACFMIMNTYVILRKEETKTVSTIQSYAMEEYLVEPILPKIVTEDSIPKVVVPVIEEIVPEVVVVKEPYLQYVSDSYNVFTPTNLTREQLIIAMGDSRNGLLDIVDAVIDAENIYGVNSIYLLSTLGLESGWGTYESSYNNIAGWKWAAGGFRDFDSRYKCVMIVAEGLATSFKPDVGETLGGVTWRYCKDDGYKETIKQIMHELQNNIY